MHKYLGWGNLPSILVIVLLLASLPPSPPGIQEAQATTDYNFIDRAAQATWRSGAGTLPFPGKDADDRGFALLRQGAQMEDGVTYPLVLQTHPQWVANGWISGSYAGITVGSGAELYVRAGFLNGAQNSDGVTFLVKLLEPGRQSVALVNLPAAYDGRLDEAVVSLAAYAGKTVAFELLVQAGQSSGQDWAAWASARIRPAAADAAGVSRGDPGRDDGGGRLQGLTVCRGRRKPFTSFLHYPATEWLLNLLFPTPNRPRIT